MTHEIKKSLGRLIKKYRASWNWTQERLAGAADVNLRTVQRAEGGQGISRENLTAIAAAFNVDEKRLVEEAENAGEAPPELRLSLRQINSPANLVKILDDAITKGHSLEIGPAEEHRFNELIGEYLVGLSSDVENATAEQKAALGQSDAAKLILGLCREMGFRLFAGNYTEEIKLKRGKSKKITTVMFAAPASDPRIRKTANHSELDVVRDSRRLLRGRLLGQMTSYEWMEDQIIGKSDGDGIVKDTLRRMIADIMRDGKHSHDGAA
jgi:transcriptional regulator with XRE-family HTH domain